MGMNIKDQRTWDAYVERLASVPISALAFGVGSAHRELPEGLRLACERHDVPLLEVPAEVPFIHVMRHVEQTLAAERYSTLRKGWDIADQCTRIAAAGGSFADMVERTAREAAARVAVVDNDGFELLSAGPFPEGRKLKGSRTSLRMPGGEEEDYRLLVQGHDADELLQPLLGPVAAVLSMQLNNTLGGRTPLHSVEAARFVDALYSRNALDSAELESLATDAGFDANKPWVVVVVRALKGASRARLRAASWRIRAGLTRTLSTVRFMETAETTTILGQGDREDAPLERTVAQLLGTFENISVVTQTTSDAADLSLVLRIAARHANTPGTRRAPAIDLNGIVDSLPDLALASLSRRLLSPLEGATGATLKTTLESFLRHSGNKGAVCAELFIHRNTLTYRLNKLEDLLGLDLDDGEVRASVLLALKFQAGN
jgi:purine catabolism regulator